MEQAKVPLTPTAPTKAITNKEPEDYWGAYCHVAMKDWPRLEHEGSFGGNWSATNVEKVMNCIADRKD
jgi:hypothetical protein